MNSRDEIIWVKMVAMAAEHDVFDDGIDIKGEEIDRALEIIMHSFPWFQTAEGGEFWQYVYRRLNHIAKTYGDK
ncbi:MAG: hypothetical protein PVI03_01565 [Candidatus Thorarchaeota archaeon]